uniref:T-box domain-containing protein n=1 Tax=Strongyloides papillosus TaxID=174720 RepID=A0A0N5BP78_STREA
MTNNKELNFSIDKILSDDFGGCRKMKDTLKNVTIELENSELWRKFYELGTEMIVTKSGRRMFPVLQIRIKGLEIKKKYSLSLKFFLMSTKKYRYSFHQSKWVTCGVGEENVGSKIFIHPDSPSSGNYWMKHVISFEKLKLTNNVFDRNGHIVVNSMQKYNVLFTIIAHHDDNDFHEIEEKHFSFKETEFMAVTAYQNHQITQLKIEKNPFAKGFREMESELFIRKDILDLF